MENLAQTSPQVENREVQDPLATRKKLASLFESFLVAKMQQGQVEPDAAKATAQTFVEIFQNATSVEAQQEAIDRLEQQENPLLHSFALRVSEMNEVQVRLDLYNYMFTIAQTGDLASARAMYQLFDRGEIHDNASLEKTIAARQNSMALKSQATTLIETLNANKKNSAAEQLKQLLESGQLQNAQDLEQWQKLIPGYVPQSETTDNAIIFTNTQTPTNRPIQAQTQKMGQLARAWEGVHQLDKKLRELLHLN